MRVGGNQVVIFFAIKSFNLDYPDFYNKNDFFFYFYIFPTEFHDKIAFISIT